MNEEVEDWLNDDESHTRIEQSRANHPICVLRCFSEDIYDVTDPVEDSKDYPVPEKELAREAH
jgi:hypothetical protein